MSGMNAIIFSIHERITLSSQLNLENVQQKACGKKLICTGIRRKRILGQRRTTTENTRKLIYSSRFVFVSLVLKEVNATQRGIFPFSCAEFSD